MSTPLPSRVRIVEVGPRDGLQNETALVETAQKIAFVDALSAAGHGAIEVTAFVSPKWVPQMGDAAAVMAGITRRPGVRYSALVPNRAGLDRAMASGVTDVAIFAAASEIIQPPQHQRVDRRVVRRPIATSRRRRSRRASACAPTCPRASGVRSRATCRWRASSR